jgi:hypothetical protein
MPTLVFGFSNGGSAYTYLDDVSVTDSNAPSVELLTNPSFENSTTSLVGWGGWCATASLCGSGFPGQVLANNTCHSGNCYYDHCHQPSMDYLVQTFSATMGDTYRISFWYQQLGIGTLKMYAYVLG